MSPRWHPHSHGQRIAACAGTSPAAEAVLWEVATGDKIRSFPGAAWQINFSPSGHLLLTGSQDGTALLWNTESGEQMARLAFLNAGVDWLVTMPDGQFDGWAGGLEALRFRVGGGLDFVTVGSAGDT